MTLAVGTRLGPYEILSPLGAGGMGEVYRARDTRLGREVAVKVLPDEVAADPERRRRFEGEARAASALNHPSIVTIHDIGSDGGLLYVVFELLEGETLRGKLAGGPLSGAQAVDWGIQVARGLAAAHEKGIVHRDLKPENLFVTRDGRVKILDFGVAKVVREEDGAGGTQAPTVTRATAPGVVLGTVGYMSPEQARGRAADHRADIFAFGAILYEMLCGRRAFAGETPADTLTAILREEPPELDTGAGGLLPACARIVRRCLAKDPQQRFQHARDLEFALEALAAPTRETGGGLAERRRSIAVLPFKNLARASDDAHLGVGLADATITELALVHSLLVRPTAAILRYRDRPVEPQEAGRELGVDAVVDGSFQSSGSRLRVTVQLVETAGGKPLWGTKIDASLEDIFGMQDEVSRKIVEALQLQLTPSDERRLAVAARPAAPAYALYLKGRFLLFSETQLSAINSAIECFEKALEADPGSPLAMVGLADAWSRMAFSFDPEGGWYERAQTLCDRALQIAPELPEARYLRGRMLWNPRSGFDHAGAIREFGAAIAGRPSLGEAHHWLAQVLLHVGLLNESVAAFERALAIYPEDLFASLHIGLARLLQGRYEEGRGMTEAALRRASSSWTYYQLAHCQLRLGLPAEAARSIERASREYPADILFLGLRGLLAARAGDAARARELAEVVVRNRRSFGHYHHAQYDLACIHALLGEETQAIARLRETAENGFPCLPFFELDPLLETVRGGAEFGRLISQLRVEQDQYRRLHAALRSESREGT
ncbi:MAG: protein kinase domain-containing protein [Thermoanaerobaculia bacterium]